VRSAHEVPALYFDIHVDIVNLRCGRALLAQLAGSIAAPDETGAVLAVDAGSIQK
jgi:hypothetical protein